MNHALIVLKKHIFLLSKIIRLESDFQSMSRLGRSPEVLYFALMDSLQKVKVRLTFSDLLA